MVLIIGVKKIKYNNNYFALLIMIKLFLKRISQFLIIPLIISSVLVCLYIKADPYSDFKEKNYNYSWKYFFQGLGDLATKKLIKSDVKYNSFIFGSSRCAGVYACYLQHKIPKSAFFNYADWNETIEGVYNKLKLLDSLKYKIDNVFWYIDTDNTFGKAYSDNNHYMLTNNSKKDYLFNHFTSFYKPIFKFNSTSKDRVKILLGLPVNGEIFPDWNSDLVTNDPNHSCDTVDFANYSKPNFNAELIRNIDSLKGTGFFYKRDTVQQYNEVQILEKERKILSKISEIFNKHNTNYYIIITPIYDQKKFHQSDYNILKAFFGNRLYDFSGINEITNNEYNFPDQKHFQEYISKRIIDQIFSDTYY